MSEFKAICEGGSLHGMRHFSTATVINKLNGKGEIAESYFKTSKSQNGLTIYKPTIKKPC